MLQAIGKDAEKMAAEHKKHFKERLGELAATRKVTFIGEEAEQNVPTIASTLSIEWKNIDMPPSERQARGIPDDYAGNLDYPADKRVGWQTEREQFMFEDVQGHRGTATSIMLVCGSEHVDNLEKKFTAADDIVTKEDVTQQVWFDSFVSQFM
jgi:hypothetical protein